MVLFHLVALLLPWILAARKVLMVQLVQEGLMVLVIRIHPLGPKVLILLLGQPHLWVRVTHPVLVVLLLQEGLQGQMVLMVLKVLVHLWVLVILVVRIPLEEYNTSKCSFYISNVSTSQTYANDYPRIFYIFI